MGNEAYAKSKLEPYIRNLVTDPDHFTHYFINFSYLFSIITESDFQNSEISSKWKLLTHIFNKSSIYSKNDNEIIGHYFHKNQKKTFRELLWEVYRS